MPGPVGFRGGSDSISSIQGGAESLLGGGEVRPFSPGYDPSVDPGAGLWRDPNAATESDSPFGLDDACEDGAPDPEFDQGGEFALDDQWKEVAPTGGPTGPIPISQVTGLIAALATKVAQTAFDLIVADLEQRLTAVEAGGGGGGGGVTTGQVNAAIAAALAPLITDIGNLTTGLTGKQDHTAELDALSALTSTTQGRQILTAASFDAMKTLLSLNLVENTADADKPVSSATALSILAAVSTAAADATAKANAAQAFAIQRANHTGTQLLATISDAGNAASRNVGTGSGDVAAGDAPAAAQAAAVQRSNHTGTQLLSTISDAGSAASRNVGTTSTTVAAGDAPAAAQAAAVAAASTDATTKANAAQAAAISAASTDATAKADAKVADAINDGVTTVAPSQNAVFDALALKVPSSRTIAGLDLSADRTAAALKTALSLVKADVGLGSVDNTADSAKTLAATQITTGTIDTDRLPDVPYTVKLAPAAAFGALGATVGESVHGTIWAGTNFAVNGSQYVLARSKVRGIAERFGFWFISATAAPGDTFYVVCYAPNANGMPGALLWSVGVLVSSLSVGANVLSGLTHPIPAGAYVGVKNGSTTGAVTLRGAGTSATHSPLADISGNYNAITATVAGPPAPTAPSGFGLAQNLPSMIVRGV